MHPQGAFSRHEVHLIRRCFGQSIIGPWFSFRGHVVHVGPLPGRLIQTFAWEGVLVQPFLSGSVRPSIGLFLGIIGFVMKLNSGFSDKVIWGYYAAMFAFILTTAQAAPMVAIAPRLAKAHWRKKSSLIGFSAWFNRATFFNGDRLKWYTIIFGPNHQFVQPNQFGFVLCNDQFPTLSKLYFFSLTVFC